MIKSRHFVIIAYGFRIALPPLGGARSAWDAGLLFIVKVQLFFVLYRLFPHWHQVVIKLTCGGQNILQTHSNQITYLSKISIFFAFYLFCGVSHSIAVQLLSLPVWHSSSQDPVKSVTHASTTTATEDSVITHH